VVFDGGRTDDELSGDLSVRASLRREARDLELLRGELVACIHGPLASTLAGRLEFDPCALSERFHPEVGQELVRLSAHCVRQYGGVHVAATRRREGGHGRDPPADVAVFADGRIRTLYTFLETSVAAGA
jgi:hypothetical protein